MNHLFNFVDENNKISIKASIDGLEAQDGDWLNLNLCVRQENLCFETTSPDLEIRELARLKNWFSQISSGHLLDSVGFSNTECSLDLNYISHRSKEVYLIVIMLGCDLRPPFDPYQRRKRTKLPGDSNDLWKTRLVLTAQDIEQTIKNLDHIMRAYPVNISERAVRNANQAQLDQMLNILKIGQSVRLPKQLLGHDRDERDVVIDPVEEAELEIGCVIAYRHPYRSRISTATIKAVHTNKFFVDDGVWLVKTQIYGRLLDMSS